MLRIALLAASLVTTLVSAQNNCYYGPGSGFRGPSNLVACNTTAEYSACCLRGDTCLTGNACYNYASGNVYQYGCTDLNYEDESCPKKCNFDPGNSPWTGLEYCNDIPNLSETWTCLSPESCGCEWNDTIGYNLALLPSRGCGAMGSDARVALYAPSTLLPYVSLPYSGDGSTGYYSKTTSDGTVSIISTAVAFYTPDPQDFTQPTSYRPAPTTAVYINAAATASPSTLAAAEIWTATTPYTPPATSSTGSASSASSANSTAGTATESTAAATSSSSPSSGGLSTGAQVGIGVGIAGGVLFAAALGICFYLTRKRKRAANANAPNQISSPPPPPQPSPGFDPNFHPYMQQSPPQMMHATNWAPVYPPGQMPYFIPPQQQKEPMHTPNSAPPYSPPSSPPPTHELDGNVQAREAFEADSSVGGQSPRPAHASVDTRFSEGPM